MLVMGRSDGEFVKECEIRLRARGWCRDYRRLPAYQVSIYALVQRVAMLMTSHGSYAA